MLKRSFETALRAEQVRVHREERGLHTTPVAFDPEIGRYAFEERLDDLLPKVRTYQAHGERQSVQWMQDSGTWGVSYPISGDTLARLKNGQPV